MKLNQKCIIIMLIASIFHAYNLNAQDVQDFVLPNYTIVDSTKGYLNDDKFKDVVMIIHDSNQMDSNILFILFGQENGKYSLSLKTTRLISLRYSNSIAVKDKKIEVATDHPWHGENRGYYELKWIENNWYCSLASSYNTDGENAWSSLLNYESGFFKISHNVSLDKGLSPTKVISDTIKNVKPFLLTSDDYYNSLSFEYKGDEYYVGDRNNLFSENEKQQILATIPETGLNSIVFNESVLDDEVVIDFDGNTYKTVMIDGTKWMAENLRVTHYADGTSIPRVTKKENWDELEVDGKAYCFYDFDSITNASFYGALYSWTAATNGGQQDPQIKTNIQGVCPSGWHLPSDDELRQLSRNYVGKTPSGNKLKEKGSTHWREPNTNATNESGFTGLPGGYCLHGSFIGKDLKGYWWSSTICPVSVTSAYALRLSNNSERADFTNHWLKLGYSVRCVKNKND